MKMRSKTGRRLKGWALAALTGVWLLTPAPEAGAEGFIRKKKDGVIYYYFNDRGRLKARTGAGALEALRAEEERSRG